MSGTDKASKVYTRTGDKGKTSLIGGARVSKSDPRLDAYGTVDELNSVIGILITEIKRELPTEKDGLIFLSRIQYELFNVGSRLACEDPALRSQLPDVKEERIKELETQMDAYSEKLTPLRNFILPGGSASASHAHLARTVCRRAERACVALDADEIPVRYLNRLSDYFFVLARHLNRLLNISEPIWKADAP